MTISFSDSMHLEILHQNAIKFAEPDLLPRPGWPVPCKERNQQLIVPLWPAVPVQTGRNSIASAGVGGAAPAKQLGGPPFAWLSWAHIGSITWHSGQCLNPQKLLNRNHSNYLPKIHSRIMPYVLWERCVCTPPAKRSLCPPHVLPWAVGMHQNLLASPRWALLPPQAQ